MRCPGTGIVALCAVIMGGCSRAPSYRAVLQDQTRAFEETAAILKSVTDEASMVEAREKLADLEDRVASIAQRAKDLGPPTEDIRASLQDDYEGLQLALKRLRTEISRVRALPGGAAFLEGLDFGKSAK